MNNSSMVTTMSDESPKNEEIIGAISKRFRRLIRTLLKGNRKRARRLAEEVAKEVPVNGRPIAFQDLIEDMAQTQAFRNAIINLPSTVPGIGTIISWALISLEDFFVLDQSVTLIMALGILHGLDPEADEGTEEFAIAVIGEAYGLESSQPGKGSAAFVKQFLIKLLPQRYVNFGLSRWVKAFIKRLLPFRRKSRLMPIGFGVAMSAWDAYDTIVKVGRITLRELPGRVHQRGFE